MPDYVVLDTDVASLSFRDRLASPMSTLLAGRITCVKFVTIGEMTKWAELRDWSRATGSDWISGCPVRYTSGTTRLWLEAGAGYPLPPSGGAERHRSTTHG